MSIDPSIIKVAIADDHEIFRDGLKLVLSKAPNVMLIGEACNGKELIELVAANTPDVVITDIKMPEMDGVAVTRYICEHYPTVGIIALSMFDEEQLILEMLDAGVTSYLLKNSDKTEVLDAITQTAVHQPYYCKQTSWKLAKLIAQKKYNKKADEGASLSEKEKEIIRLICQEYTNKQIGETIFMSARTVEGYRQRIQEKLSVKNTVGIAIAAIRLGIYNPDEKEA